MPLSYTLSSARKLILATAAGVVAREDMDQLRGQLLGDERIGGDMRLLLDANDADPKLTFTDLQEIAGRLQGLFDKGISRVAIVAESSFIKSLAKTFCVFAENAPVRVQPFATTDDAVLWLQSAQQTSSGPRTT